MNASARILGHDTGANPAMRIGIDLGGTKTEAMLMAPDGSDKMRLRVPTPAKDYPANLDMLASLVAQLDEKAGHPCPVGIGIPGAMSPQTRLIKNANSTWLIGEPFLADLENRLGPRVRIANDADCFTLSEATDGAGAAFNTVFGVILGTGVGGGLVVNGSLLSGPNAIAGEWGHTPLAWMTDQEHPGPDCYCGKKGCVEAWCSGPALAADHARVAGEVRSPEEIVARAHSGNVAARSTLDRHADRLARALSTVINIIDPKAIVLGGGLSDLDHLYPQVMSRLPDYVFSDTVVTPVLKNQHGASSGIRGAAWLWPVDASVGVD